MCHSFFTVDSSFDYSFDFDDELVHPPTNPHRVLAVVECVFQLWAICDDPAVHGGVIHADPHSSMSSSTWGVLKGYARYQRTLMSMTSLGKCAPLKLIAIVSPESFTVDHRGRSYPKSPQMKIVT